MTGQFRPFRGRYFAQQSKCLPQPVTECWAAAHPVSRQETAGCYPDGRHSWSSWPQASPEPSPGHRTVSQQDTSSLTLITLHEISCSQNYKYTMWELKFYEQTKSKNNETSVCISITENIVLWNFLLNLCQCLSMWSTVTLKFTVQLMKWSFFHEITVDSHCQYSH